MSILGYPESKLRQLSTDNQRKQPSLIQPLKACLPKEREDMTEVIYDHSSTYLGTIYGNCFCLTCQVMCTFHQIQIIVGCLLSGPLPEKQLLHTLEPSLTQLMVGLLHVLLLVCLCDTEICQCISC